MNTQSFQAIESAYFKARCKMKGHDMLFTKWKNVLLSCPGPDLFSAHVQIQKISLLRVLNCCSLYHFHFISRIALV